jgi:hypothetical protein
VKATLKRRSSGLQDFGAGEGEGEDSDVIFLAEVLRGAGDLFCGLAADGAGAIETVEFALGVAGFDDAVGEEGEGVAGSELESGLGIPGVVEAERQMKGEGDLFCVPIRGKVAALARRRVLSGVRSAQRQAAKILSD